MEDLLGRARVAEDGQGLRMSIPVARNWFVIVFLVAWTGGWAFGESMALGALSEAGEEALFLGFWLLGWTAGGLTALGVLAWQLGGSEEIVLSQDILSVGKKVGPLRWARTYQAPRITDLGVRPLPTAALARGPAAFGALNTGYPRIQFRYGLKTRSFGLGLDDAEAEHLVGLLKNSLRIRT